MFMLPYEQKVKIFQTNSVYIRRICSVKSCVWNAVFWHTIILLLVYCPVDDSCSKSAQKFTIAVVMETLQLVLCQFKTFYPSQLG